MSSIYALFTSALEVRESGVQTGYTQQFYNESHECMHNDKSVVHFMRSGWFLICSSALETRAETRNDCIFLDWVWTTSLSKGFNSN